MGRKSQFVEALEPLVNMVEPLCDKGLNFVAEKKLWIIIGIFVLLIGGMIWGFSLLIKWA